VLRALIVVGMALVVGCGEAPQIDGVTGAEGGSAKADRGDDESPFEPALDVLRIMAEAGDTELQRGLARETVERIERGDVILAAIGCVPNNYSCTRDGAPSAQVVINEVLADPPNDASGDTNADGWFDADEDEFVELVNASGKAVSLSGWTLSDDTTVRFTFPQGVSLPKGAAAVVYGGGDPSEMAYTEARLFTAQDGLRLANKGDTVILRDAEGRVIDRIVFGAEANTDQSLNRAKDGSPDAEFIPHSQAAGTPFSPGTTTDGFVF
jgi:hypothetical protein